MIRTEELVTGKREKSKIKTQRLMPGWGGGWGVLRGQKQKIKTKKSNTDINGSWDDGDYL